MCVRFACLLVVLSVISGCAVNPATNKRQFVLTSEAREAELGREAAAQVRESMGTIESGPVADYVSRVGQSVAAKAPAGQFTYQFRVVEMSEPNAFAVPGGYVFISRGLLALTNTEGELAGILGHEIGHVAARHGTNQASVQAPLRVVTGLSAAVTGIVSSSLGDSVSALGGAATDALFASYSRDQEREADELAQRFMSESAYDPVALSSALDSLHRHAVEAGQDDGPSFFSSHPSTRERIDRTRARARGLAGSRKASTQDRSAHVSRLDGLRLGPDPAHGVFVENEFLQPAMDFRFQFPTNWETVNGRDFVGATAESSLLVITLAEGDDPMMVGREIERRDGVDLKLRPIRIGGRPAARGEAQARTEDGAAILDVAWIEHDGQMYQVIGVSPAGSRDDRNSISRSMDSFRPLSARDRDRIRVERMRIVRARSNETMAQVKARTASTWEVRDLEVLNGIPSGRRFSAREKVKIVRLERY